MNTLYFGDNLTVLREHVKDESVDLVYLDPPFNSNATYNVLFQERAGAPSEAQAEAFRDTWGWGETAALAYDETLRAGGDAALLLRTFRSWLGDNAMMAYLAMMAVRFIELRRVIKPTGSLYLHCDPTASHYLKLLLDSIFGFRNYRSEIVWKRTSAHSDASVGFGDVTDHIFFYTLSPDATWNQIRAPLSDEHVKSKYTYVEPDGRRYATRDLRSPHPRPNLTYDYKGYKPHPNGWSISRELMERYDREGRLYFPTRGGRIRLKNYLAESKGQPLQSLWTDIPPINSQAQERLGYPTQKPIALLERIISASSKEGDLVLDPFCGCGTTIEAAERLGRQWTGIDVTHYAITLIERRLKNAPTHPSYAVHGRPTDLAGARDLARRDKHQFQWWAAWLLGTQTYESKKGADRGIDGNIYFANGPYGYGRIVVSVKGGDNVSPAMVRELSGVVQRETDASMGVLITLAEPTKSMLADAAGAGFVEKSAHGRLPRIQIVTVDDLLDGRFPKMPPLPRPMEAATRSRAARDRDQLELLLPLTGTGSQTKDGAFLDPRFLELNKSA